MLRLHRKGVPVWLDASSFSCPLCPCPCHAAALMLLIRKFWNLWKQFFQTLLVPGESSAFLPQKQREQLVRERELMRQQLVHQQHVRERELVRQQLLLRLLVAPCI